MESAATTDKYLCAIMNLVRIPAEDGLEAMQIDDSLIREIVQRIVSVTQPERVILFGSASTGQMTKDSDIDLLILERNPRDARAEKLRIRQALKDLGHPFDIIVMSTENFEESKDVIGGIAYPANKYGRVVYEIA